MIVDVAKYNLIRQALANQADDEQDVDVIRIAPKTFALKKKHDEDVLSAAIEILLDKRVITGITPLDTIVSLVEGNEQPPVEVILYVMVCYAIAVQQEWVTYSTILNKFIINRDHKEATEFVEDSLRINI